jgi:1-acyl-sn-glycerol-3-phosphate acyltransferase
MFSKLNQHHPETVSAAPAPRHGQLWRWASARFRHGYGVDPLQFDPEFVMNVMEKLSLLYGGPGRYFELTVRGLERLPPAPVMLISNHSGGTTIPDVWGFGVAWYRQFGATRPLHILCHELLFAVPGFARFFERLGAVRASLEAGRQIIGLGRDVLIFPGGDLETWRPYSRRYHVDFGGRTGYARLALEQQVPVVPVAHAGAHETLRVLTSGRRFARWVGLRRIARAEIWPIHLSLPWGLGVGPLPHLPLPARFRYLVGKPVLPVEATTVRQLADQVEAAVQRQLDVLQREDEARRRARH